MKTERKTIKLKHGVVIIVNLVSMVSAIPLMLLGLDLLTKEIFRIVKPQIELQLANQTQNPVRIGSYQGLCVGGISVGSSLLGPGYKTHSTISSSYLNLSIVPLSSFYHKRLVLNVRCGKTELSLRRNQQGYYFYAPRIENRNQLPFSLNANIEFYEPIKMKIYPSHLFTYLNLKAQIRIPENLIKIQGTVNTLNKGSIYFLCTGSINNFKFQLRMILAGLDLSIFTAMIKDFRSLGIYGKLFGDIYSNWAQEKITCLGSVDVHDFQIPLSKGKYSTKQPPFNILCQGTTLQLNRLQWRYDPWKISLRSKLYLHG